MKAAKIVFSVLMISVCLVLFCVASFADTAPLTLEEVTSEYPVKLVYVGDGLVSSISNQGFPLGIVAVNGSSPYFGVVTSIGFYESVTTGSSYSTYCGSTPKTFILNISEYEFYTTQEIYKEFFMNDDGWQAVYLPGVTGGLTSTFSGTSGFVSDLAGSVSDLFWDAEEEELTVCGTLGLVALGISVVFLLIGFISKFVHLGG